MSDGLWVVVALGADGEVVKTYGRSGLAEGVARQLADRKTRQYPTKQFDAQPVESE